MATTIDLVVNSNGVTVLNQTTVAAEGTAEAVKSLNTQFNDLKKQQQQYKPNTKEFKELTLQMAELKKQMKESADAVNQNAQPAIESLRNTFGTMKDQVMNFNFEGVTQSLQSFTANLGRINVSSITGSLKAMLSAGVQGFKVLGNVIKQNPIFLLAGVLVTVISYWKEINEFFSGKGAKIDGLNKQLSVIKEQEAALNRQKASAIALKANAGEILKLDVNILQNKKAQAEVALRLAELEGDSEKANQAISEMAQAELEIQTKLLKVRQDAEVLINKILGAGSQDYERQVKQAQVFEEYKDSSEKLHGLQLLNNEKILALQEELQLAKDYEDISQQKFIKGQIESLKKDNESLQIKKDAIWNAGEAAKAQVKTDKEIADAAASKLKAEAEAKKLADELLTIKKELADWDRRNLSDLDKELFLLNERQKLEVETYKKAKKSAEETAALLKFHQEEEQAIRDKYAKIQSDKENQATQQRLNAKQLELIELQDIIDAADEANFQTTLSKQNQELIANKDYYFNLITQAETAGLDTAALIEEQGRKENQIKDKYRKEDEAKQTATQEFRLKQLSESLGALSALNEAFTKKGQQQSKKQFQIQKALNYASAVIDTYGGINRALNDKTMPSTTARIIQASIVGAMGLANVIKIAKTEYGAATPPSGTNMTSGGGGDNGTTAPSPANFAFLQNQPNQQPPLQAYVVGTQVSSNLEAQQLIQNQSRLGG
jgi:hypothetical protein